MPYTYLQQDNNYQKFNDSSIQDKFLHSSFEKSKDKQICSNNTCGTCELQEIELCVKLRSFVIYISILCNFVRETSRNKITTIFFKCRDTVHSASKLQDALVPSKTIRTVDIATETNNCITVEHETQTDLLHVRKEYERYINQYKIQIFSITYCYNVNRNGNTSQATTKEKRFISTK